MNAVPVVPGDDRVACQHCPARIKPTSVGEWIDPDAVTGWIAWCRPGMRHKPMPTVRAAR